MKRIDKYDPETGVYQCILFYKNEKIVGEAKCHPHDKEFASEWTGGFIAESRAYIKYYQFRKNYEVKPALAALRHVVGCIDKDSRSHEAGILRHNLKAKENELKDLEDILRTEKKTLNDYITAKNEILAKLVKKSSSIKE